MVRTKRRVALGLVLVMVYTLGGCGNQVPPDDDTPPEIPPQSTFKMDFSDFEEEDGTATTRVAQALPGSNWNYSAGVVVVWSTIVAVTLAVPVAAFVESFNHEPERQTDGSWVWSYDVTVDDDVYTASLSAKAQGGDINWKMLVSKEGEYTDFEWFTGVSNLIGTEGEWTLNRDPDDPELFIQIDWTRDPDSQTGSLQYTNIVPGGLLNGGYIMAATSEEEPFDARYHVYDNLAQNLTEIEWNLESLDGRVKDERHFEDEDWHCWDVALQNADCG